MATVTRNSKVDTLYIEQAILSPVLNDIPSRRVDISNLISQLIISESITSNTLNISCLIIDNVGLLESFPLRGEERVRLVVKDFQDVTITYDLFLYKVDNVTPKSDGDGLSYNAYFVSYQHFIAGSTKLIRAFKGKKIVTLVDELFKEFYSSGTKTLEIENEEDASDNLTENQIRGTIPNMTVPQAIEFLVRRSYSTKRKTSSFRFFENSDSFFFISDEGLEDYAKLNNKIFNFTSTRIPDDPAYFEQQRNNLDSITNTNRFNTLDDMFGGAYKNNVLEIDILRKIYTKKKYDYLKDGKKYFNAGPFRTIVDRHTEDFSNEFFTENNAKEFYMIKDYMEIDDFNDSALAGNKFFPEMVSNRHAFRTHLNSTMVEAVGPCRLDVTAGSIINLEITKFKAAVNKVERNEQLSGKYIVKSVNRVMNGETSKNRYILVKRDWNDVKFTYEFGGGR